MGEMADFYLDSEDPFEHETYLEPEDGDGPSIKAPLHCKNCNAGPFIWLRLSGTLNGHPHGCWRLCDPFTHKKHHCPVVCDPFDENPPCP